MKCLNVFLVAFAWVHITWAECPAGIISRGTSKIEQDQIINLHNALRQKLALGQVPNQPTGKNFETMVWDDQLAQKAQEVANTCIFKHVSIKDGKFINSNSTVFDMEVFLIGRWNWVGQNIYALSGTSAGIKTNWANGFSCWTDNELPGYTYGTTIYNHYTQAIWAKTKYVGCAMAFYQEPSKWYTKLYVCNYGPGGNIVGSYPYEKA